MGPHNGVQAVSTRGAPRWQSEVGVSECSDCDFDASLSNLAGLFLQDKTSWVMGSRGGPSDDQVRIISKGEVRRPLLRRRSFFSSLVEVGRESQRVPMEGP
ncbi:hypothetical protein B296_00015467 [Ensete ventricosum]|uniref:Uncharacterized protein n=1 Tax=Ensete ventricosum TaxID=4639 RepID=A0A426Y9J9_ENSVE|nr:hypothetical protein B296_00015467 [Ensete ventricosum]